MGKSPVSIETFKTFISAAGIVVSESNLSSPLNLIVFSWWIGRGSFRMGIRLFLWWPAYVCLWDTISQIKPFQRSNQTRILGPCTHLTITWRDYVSYNSPTLQIRLFGNGYLETSHKSSDARSQHTSGSSPINIPLCSYRIKIPSDYRRWFSKEPGGLPAA